MLSRKCFASNSMPISCLRHGSDRLGIWPTRAFLFRIYRTRLPLGVVRGGEEGATWSNFSLRQHADNMSQSPAKRRKTTASSSVPATEQDTNTQSQTNPTTPTRASYLSPTKASLARSHPHLVSTKSAQSLTQPRGPLLRNELLSKKGYIAPQTEKPQSMPIEISRDDQNPSEPTAERQPDEEPTIPSDTTSRRSALKQRQSAAQKQIQRYSDSPDPLPPPTLVKKADTAPRAASRPRSNEPDLPPTPVQLGLDAPPERPKGLSSSSPQGSKSGSGRRRIRARNGQSVTSSPLKQKPDRPVMHDLESQPDMAREAPESQLPDLEALEEVLPEELKAKKQTVRSLTVELNKLKEETTLLEEALNTHGLGEDAALNNSLVTILKSAAPSRTSENSEFEREVSGKESQYPFHDLFAPGNLQLKIRTATKMTKGHAKIIHHVSLTAPSPWPSNIFSANFEVITDAEDARVEKVIWVDSLKGHRQALGIQDELHTWIQNRLKSELHRLDIGGLIWGVGQYFIASIERTKTFRALARKYKAVSDGFEGDEEDDEQESHSKDGTLTEDEAVALSRYLIKSQLTFEATSDSGSAVTTRRSKKAAPKIIAVWKLEPTWHGQIRSVCEIAPSGIPDSAQESIAELFERVKKVGGFEKAFGAVWDMIMQVVGKCEDGDGKKNAESKAPKKRKRFS